MRQMSGRLNFSGSAGRQERHLQAGDHARHFRHGGRSCRQAGILFKDNKAGRKVKAGSTLGRRQAGEAEQID